MILWQVREHRINKLFKKITRTFHWEFCRKPQLLSKFEMRLRTAGRAQIPAHESGSLSRIASETNQFFKPGPSEPGLAGTWSYHLNGRSPRTSCERVSFSPVSINLMKTRDGERSVKNRSSFDIRNNLRIDSDFCPPGSSRPPEGTKEANWRSTGKYE